MLEFNSLPALPCLLYSLSTHILHADYTLLLLMLDMLRVLSPAASHTGAAGFVLLSLVNFILIIVLGKDVGYEATNNPYQQAKASGIQFQTSAPV